MEIEMMIEALKRCENNTINKVFRYIVLNCYGEIVAGFCCYDDADEYYGQHDDGFYKIISLVE